MSRLTALAAALALATGSAHCAGITLERAPLSLTLDPHTGARVTSLRYGDRDLLALSDSDGSNYGSTFWLSPQSLWGWPPVAAHDSGAYALLQQTPCSARLRSAEGAGARVEKRLQLLEGGQVRRDYRIDATRDFDQVAAWEITRVERAGVAFAPVRAASVQTVRGSVEHRISDGVLWLDLQADTPLREGKLIANGSEGWLAYARDRLLYLIAYPPVAPDRVADGEGDVELYLSGRHPYLELEVQSAAQRLTSGDTLHWQTRWLLAPIPEHITVSAGSAELLAFARRQRAAVRLSAADTTSGPQ